MVSLDFLEQVEVFKDLGDDQLAAVRNCCQEAEYRRDEKIFGAKEEPLFLWAVIDGEVVLKLQLPESSPLNNDTIATLSPTMTFGWSSLVPPSEYSLSAYCSSRRCKVLKVDRKDLCDLFEKDAELGYLVMSKIVSVVGYRFHQLREEIIKSIGHDIINRW